MQEPTDISFSDIKAMPLIASAFAKTHAQLVSRLELPPVGAVRLRDAYRNAGPPGGLPPLLFYLVVLTMQYPSDDASWQSSSVNFATASRSSFSSSRWSCIMDMQLDISGSYPSSSPPDHIRWASSREEIRRAAAPEPSPGNNAAFRSVKKMKELFQLVLPSSSFPNSVPPPGNGTWCSRQRSIPKTPRPLQLLPIPTLLDQRTAQEFLSPILEIERESASADRDRDTLASYHALEGKRPRGANCKSLGTSSVSADTSSSGSLASMCTAHTRISSSESSAQHNTTTSFRDVRICGTNHGDKVWKSPPQPAPAVY